MFALVFILVWIKLVDIFAVVTLAELRIAVKALLEADTVVLLAPVALAVAALAHEESVLDEDVQALADGGSGNSESFGEGAFRRKFAFFAVDTAGDLIG